MIPVAERLIRTNPADLELRGGDGRTVAGLAVPFDVPADIAEPGRSYRETFQRGAFSRTIAERADRVKFMAMHDRQRLPVGRASLLREDSAGLYGEFRVSKTAAGDELLELVRDGAVDGLSIGFRPLRDRWSPDHAQVERLEVALAEVSAVAFPAYETALVSAVRDEGPRISASDALARLALHPQPPTVPVEDARRRLATILERGTPQ